MKLATRTIQKTQGFIGLLHFRAISVQLFFSSWHLKKEKTRVLECLSLDLVVRNVCCSFDGCSHVRGCKTMEKHKFYKVSWFW